MAWGALPEGPVNSSWRCWRRSRTWNGSPLRAVARSVIGSEAGRQGAIQIDHRDHAAFVCADSHGIALADRLKALREQRGAIVTEMRAVQDKAVAEKRDMTDEELAKHGVASGMGKFIDEASYQKTPA